MQLIMTLLPSAIFIESNLPNRILNWKDYKNLLRLQTGYEYTISDEINTLYGCSSKIFTSNHSVDLSGGCKP